MFGLANHPYAKRRAGSIVSDLLKNNIRAFMTEKQGTFVVNLSKAWRDVVKRCITRLVKHKNSRVQYISDLKLYLTQQYKVLYQDAVRYSKQTETSKNKRDPIHFFLHDK